MRNAESPVDGSGSPTLQPPQAGCTGDRQGVMLLHLGASLAHTAPGLRHGGPVCCGHER